MIINVTSDSILCIANRDDIVSINISKHKRTIYNLITIAEI